MTKSNKKAAIAAAKSRPTMKELADRIHTHLKRFEADPAINVETGRDPGTSVGKGLRRFFGAHAVYVGNGSRIHVGYISYQGMNTITRDEAERYLKKLDAGFVGRHFEALRERKGR